ncbi:hypothetical protein J2D73_11690 [Acetobacter sacchari]|uniref:Uncharacterized protein n=1 Tax=Acetobacter sacchari TaxID=2661687 RepID=A0ABS3LWZ5_9PROT|nr:hypothetical protein [Acetobacter sacchari]MBO1360450.1 hypothetical protein [Acetobacter sacchari]
MIDNMTNGVALARIADTAISDKNSNDTQSLLREIQELTELFEEILAKEGGQKTGNGGDPAESSLAKGLGAVAPFADISKTPVNTPAPSPAGLAATPLNATPPAMVQVALPLSPFDKTTLANSALTAGSSDAGASCTSAGSGNNAMVITNTSNHDEKIGQFLNGGSITQPAAEIDLKPGQTGTLRYQNGEGGFDAEANSSGQFQPTASRLEFYADSKGMNNDDVSYIDGDNAAISVNDGHGRFAGETQSMAFSAPSDIVSRDSGGLPTITGWYDGSTQAMQAGGAYIQDKLGGTGAAYIHPDDDRNATEKNPMTMEQDSSATYYVEFGEA